MSCLFSCVSSSRSAHVNAHRVAPEACDGGSQQYTEALERLHRAELAVDAAHKKAKQVRGGIAARVPSLLPRAVLPSPRSSPAPRIIASSLGPLPLTAPVAEPFHTTHVVRLP